MDTMPNCRQCEYFQTTWDRAAPLGCKRFGFKTRQLPSLEVLASTGRHCCFFEPKSPLPQSDQPVSNSGETTALPEHSTFSITG